LINALVNEVQLTAICRLQVLIMESGNTDSLYKVDF